MLCSENLWTSLGQSVCASPSLANVNQFGPHPPKSAKDVHFGPKMARPWNELVQCWQTSGQLRSIFGYKRADVGRVVATLAPTTANKLWLRYRCGCVIGGARVERAARLRVFLESAPKIGVNNTRSRPRGGGGRLIARGSVGQEGDDDAGSSAPLSSRCRGQRSNAGLPDHRLDI